MRKVLSSIIERGRKYLSSDPEPAPPITLQEAIRNARSREVQEIERHNLLQSLRSTIGKLTGMVEAGQSDRMANAEFLEYRERAHELVEARQMAGSGPWLVAEARKAIAENPSIAGVKLQESGNPLLSQGAYGDMELALQNINWRREINLSWLEFSRWGIQQIILISRLYYIKNPPIRRLVDIAAQYVFARGVEVSSPDEDANEVLRDFFERNKAIVGQIGLTNLERAKYLDGNIFFALFTDKENTGQVNVRTIDSTEMQDIVCDPDDSDKPWFYRRTWTQRNFNLVNGSATTETKDLWYPALDYDPDEKPEKIGGIEVKWDVPILHVKCGTTSKWHFGCPLIYPALDWAREARRLLEAFASVMQALSQIAITITTKGGQQALAGIKQQLETTVGPSSPLWDQNPPNVSGGTFASGSGTSYEAFKTQGAGQDPEKVRRYLLMACMTVGVPETFLADVSCYSADTEVLTDQGFMLHQQWHPGIKVACFNPKSRRIEYHHPNELRQFDYSGEMVHFKNCQTDILVTPNHRMWAEPIVGWSPMEPSSKDMKRGAKVDRGWRIIEAAEVHKSKRSKGWKFSTVVREDDQPIATIDTPIGPQDPVEWARFLGYWIAEGCATQSVCKSGEYRKDGSAILRTFRRVMIAQKPGPTLSKMRTNLNAMGLRFHEVVATAGVINLVIVRKLLWEHLRAECGSGAHSKHIPRWILTAPMAARKAIYDALMEGDGGRSGGSWCYNTASPRLADDMQLLAHSIGLAASVSRADRLYNGEPHALFRVYIRTRATEARVVKPKDISRSKYAGRVYCFSLPHGIYVTRRNGKIAVQGNTGNLATATTLDRPTELVFLERQEAWRETLNTMAKYVLRVSARATNGDLREALELRGVNPGGVLFREVARKQLPDGKWVYVEEAVKRKLRSKAKSSAIEVKCTFPSIREGDIPELIKSVVDAMTLGTKDGKVVGIDEKEGVKLLFEYIGVENAAELVEEMYPDYDPERVEEEPPPMPGVPGAPLPGTPPVPGAPPARVPQLTQPPQEDDTEDPPAPPAGKTAVRAHHRALPKKTAAEVKEALTRLLVAVEGLSNELVDDDVSVIEGAEDMHIFEVPAEDDDPFVDLFNEGWVTINGQAINVGADSSIASVKALLAKKHMVVTDKAVQDVAEKTEAKLATALGVPRTKDNSAFDLRNNKVGIEVKTMVTGKNEKITMSKAALQRKMDEIKKSKIKPFTVVADMRGGRGSARYYVAARLGSLRLSTMTPVTLPQLKSMVRGGK